MAVIPSYFPRLRLQGVAGAERAELKRGERSSNLDILKYYLSRKFVPEAAAGSPFHDDEDDENGHANRSWLEIGF